MKCVLFGGGGFIGSAITDRLLQEGHSVRIFERPNVQPYRRFTAAENVEWMFGDILSATDLVPAIEGADAVIHLVSFSLPKSSNDNPIYDVQTNLVSTLQILNAMVAHKVPRIVFISSGGTVYGTPLYLPIDEAHPTDPQVSYGVTKLAIEKYLQIYQRQHGIRALILRVANPYGRRQRVETAQGAVGVFLYRVLHGMPIDIWGDGGITRDYLHVGDVADAFLCAIGYQGPHTVFNISSGEGTSLNQLLDHLEALLGRSITRRYLPSRAFDVSVSVLSNERAKAELGWRPRITLEAGLRDTAEWFRDHSRP